MKLKFSLKYLFLTLFIFGIEVLIAMYASGFIRHFIGDVLVVILIYFFLRSFIASKNIAFLILGIFIFAVIIEVLQLFNLPKLVGMEDNKIASIVLGSTFDWMDVLAYGIGSLILWIGSINISKSKKPN